MYIHHVDDSVSILLVPNWSKTAEVMLVDWQQPRCEETMSKRDIYTLQQLITLLLNNAHVVLPSQVEPR